MTKGFTLWSVIGHGEAGSRIAGNYYATLPNAAIEDRVVILNTAQADLTQLLQALEKDVGPEAKDRFNEFRAKVSDPIGRSGGAGNDGLTGERILDQNWGDAADVIRRIGGAADVFVHVTSLGGGTGNGFAPLAMRKIRDGQVKDIVRGGKQFAITVWPDSSEDAHQQVNALNGLSRLLRYEDKDGLHPNADFVLLLGNDQLDAGGAARGFREGSKHQAANRLVVEIVNALISPGQNSAAVIDAQDYCMPRNNFEVQHFTAGVAWDRDIDELFDGAITDAFTKPLLPIDPMTSRFAYAVLQVPEDKFDDPEYSPSALSRALHDWKKKRNVKFLGQMQSVVPSSKLTDTYNLFLFLGGFDLKRFILTFQQDVKESLRQKRRMKSADLNRQADEYEKLWNQLIEYAGGESIDVQTE